METIWTIDGDEKSWAEWAAQMTCSSASQAIRQLAFSLKPGCQNWALDIGCGVGRSFLPLVENGYRVLGIDPIKQAVAASRARVRQEKLLAWPVLASASQLPFDSQSIRAVFAIGVLFHLSPKELDKALCEIHRVLQPGGEAILHFLDHRDWRQKLGAKKEAEEIPEPSYQALVTCFCSENVIREWIIQTGLCIQGGFLKTKKDEAGVRRDWFFSCIRVS
jgi:ubiquinone/menaquinone biosynthesis C-methylase UbiE